MSRPLHWMPQRVRQRHTSLDITRCALGLGPGDTPGGDTPGLEVRNSNMRARTWEQFLLKLHCFHDQSSTSQLPEKLGRDGHVTSHAAPRSAPGESVCPDPKF